MEQKATRMAMLRLHENFSCFDGRSAEDAPVALDLVFRAGGFTRIVAELDGGAAVHGDQLTYEADGFEVGLAARMAVAKVVGEQCAPAGRETDTAIEVDEEAQ